MSKMHQRSSKNRSLAPAPGVAQLASLSDRSPRVLASEAIVSLAGQTYSFSRTTKREGVARCLKKPQRSVSI
jgi:hypothetical protein